MKFFMIQHKTTKMWSRGGTRVINSNSTCWWAEKKRFGKIWKGTGPLKNHLNQFSKTQTDKWDIVEIELNLED